MTEIAVIYNGELEKRYIIREYRNRCHSYLIDKNRIIFNFVNADAALIREIKFRYKVQYVVKPDRRDLNKKRVSRGEVVKLNLGYKCGEEYGGISYGIVMQNNSGNMNSNTTIVLLIDKYHKLTLDQDFEMHLVINGQDCVANLTALRTVDYERISKLGLFLEKEDLDKLGERLLHVIL